MSFKVVLGASQLGRWRATPPSGFTTSTSVIVFGWMKAPTGKYTTLLSMYAGPDVAKTDIYSWWYKETNNVYHANCKVYGYSTRTPEGTPWTTNTWLGCLGTATLGAAPTCQISGGSEGTASALEAAWATTPGTLLIGSVHNGGTSDSQTFYLAHIVLAKGTLTSTQKSNLLASSGNNPRSVIGDANIVEYWDGTSLTGMNGTVLTWEGTGTGTVNDADNPTVDAPPGGGSAVPVLMHHRRQMEA